MGIDDEETVNQIPTQVKQQNDISTAPTTNSSTQGGRRNNYRRKHKNNMVNLVASYFVGETPELGGVMG